MLNLQQVSSQTLSSFDSWYALLTNKIILHCSLQVSYGKNMSERKVELSSAYCFYFCFIPVQLLCWIVMDVYCLHILSEVMGGLTKTKWVN